MCESGKSCHSISIPMCRKFQEIPVMVLGDPFLASQKEFDGVNRYDSTITFQWFALFLFAQNVQMKGAFIFMCK